MMEEIRNKNNTTEDHLEHDDINNFCPACKRDSNIKTIKTLETAIAYIDGKYMGLQRETLRAGPVFMLEDVKKEQEELIRRKK